MICFRALNAYTECFKPFMSNCESEERNALKLLDDSYDKICDENVKGMWSFNNNS